MKNSHLLEVLNNVSRPDEILTKLSQVNFAVTDVTDEGDSVLHVLANSNHAKNGDFSMYLKILMEAGANANAVNKQGNNFLCDYLKHAASYEVDKTFDLLLENKDFNINQTSATGQTFFEGIYHSSGYNLRDTFTAFIRHKEFDPNQKTSKHNSILLHMFSETSYQFREHIYEVVEHPKTNPNLKNNNGQTALAQSLSETRYQDMQLIRSLINHEQCEIDTLDKDENNYLQLAIISCKYQAEDIAALLIKKGIDVTHKNKEGKSVFDLIAENKANRSEYTNTTLLLNVVKLHPASLFEKDSSGKTILGGLLRRDDYTVRLEFRTLLELCKNQKDSTKFLKSIISDCFNDFSQNLVSREAIESLVQAIIEADVGIDVEYCIAHTAVCSSSVWRDEIYNNFRKLKPQFDLNAVIGHVKNLTKEGSDEQLRAIGEACELGLQLDCFDESVLAYEEHYLRSKTTTGIEKDSKMFGHLFSLSGSIPVNNSLLTLTGSSSSSTAPFLTHLMNAYVSHCEKSGAHAEHLDAVRQVRNMTIKAMRYYFLSQPWGSYYSSIKSSGNNFLSSMIADSKTSGVEVFTGWPEHGIDLIVKEESLYRNNGGGCSTDATTEHYNMSKVGNLTEEVFAKLYADSAEESNKSYIQRDLHDLLGLTFENIIPGKFQTVGNCSLESKLIALKVKYRLFLPESIADALFADTIKFFEQFYLEEYLSLYSNNPALPHLLMRLIIQKLVPEERLELAGELLKNHFTSEASQEIMQVEFMLQQWRLRSTGGNIEQFDKQLQSLGVVLNPDLNSRLQIFQRFLYDKVTAEDLEELKSWSLEKQTFQGYHLLHFAVISNNLVLASSLIQMFPQAVNQTNWFSKEPLCLVKSVEMIDLLVKSGASTARTDDGNALDCAINANRVDLVSALLRHGVKPSEYSAYAAASKDSKILQKLMEYHPETVTKPTHDYSTAAHAAASSGHNENLHALVYYGGVNPAASDVNGVTPLQLALKHKHNETAKLLIQYPGTLFNPSYRGDSVVSMTKDEDVKQIIELKRAERKADREYFDKFKNSKPGIIEEDVDYLILAIRNHDVRAIRGCLLAYHDIKVVKYSNLYCTAPLTEAIQNLARCEKDKYEETLEIVRMLLKTPGIDINALMASSEPILFMATSIGNVAALELFLADPKLDPNQQDNIGYTALHDAVERGHLACVKRLLQDERVDSTIVNNRHQTAAELRGFGYREGIEECREEVAKHQLSMQMRSISSVCN
ncbi:ankyrin repeat domain-containing protein [Legionella maioricensis]|uniref:Ankyrin repeat domain-containing protein n=1 Tax=Legionella maioricensis TaxID=2896528 RepID=A0A9X2D0A7_9GAMM|nr:ankyrin repeat domain-containing protein [Legionella maioricensis]MCL9683954.1 ankyrin repeat domain-containing protein [Legionella maioricensis]MCL9688280.1 ankyrin repeat domain-containing protein [Legionella maioricensis]